MVGVVLCCAVSGGWLLRDLLGCSPDMALLLNVIYWDLSRTAGEQLAI
jgi:hypothetical protein